MAKGMKTRAEQMAEEIREKYGILVSYKDVMKMLGYKTPGSANNWLARNGVPATGKKGMYYSADVAKAMTENGGVVL